MSTVVLAMVSLAIAVWAVSVGSVDIVVGSESGSVSATVVVVAVVAWLVSEVSDAVSISSSVAIAVGAISVGSIDTVVRSESGSVSVTVVVVVAVVAWFVSEVSDAVSLSSAVDISVVVVRLVTG